MNRPCKCGCKFEDHAKLKEGSRTVQYCLECPKWGDEWCDYYSPIGNLEWLEYLYDKTH
jgi:hypothetical protein